jgi:hypothetical protein
VIAYGVEAFVFGYLGLTFFAYFDYEWSWQLIVAEIIIVMSGRLFATVVVVKVLE